jgi:hypothetical protein
MSYPSVTITVERDGATDNYLFICKEANLCFVMTREADWSKFPAQFDALHGRALEEVLEHQDSQTAKGLA